MSVISSKPGPPDRNDYVPVSRDLEGEEDWKPQFIIYSLLKISGTPENMTAENVSGTRRFPAEDIYNFLRRAAADGGVKWKNAQEIHTAHKPTYSTPLDIQVHGTCDVVIQLDKTGNVQFARTGEPITSKEDYGTTNRALSLCNRAGLRVTGAAPEDCRLVHFRAVRPDLLAQHFNLHVEFLVAGKEPIPHIIDPDFPNDGGHIPFMDI